MAASNCRKACVWLIAILLLGLPNQFAQTPRAPIRLSVDAREATRGILHATLTIPARPGPLTLLYPKWIPGNHAPTGPISELAGLRATAAGKEIVWGRDPLDMHTFRLEVPAGASAVELALDYLIPLGAAGSTSGASVTPNLLILNWNSVVLYPQGETVQELSYAARVQLPAGWSHATALPIKEQSASVIDFMPVSLYTLMDSPVIAGAHFRTVPLSEGPGSSHELAMVSDSAAALDITPEVTGHYRQLVAEANALFGARHYESYRFLVTLSDHVAGGGLEHHESSDDRLREKGLTEDSWRNVSASLLPHEFVHSWNGKYRRPAGLVQSDFHQTLNTDLLWVYEGLTEYLGMVLSARSGLWTDVDFRESLAETAAFLDNRPGRTWLPLGEVAVASPVLRTVRPEWGSWRRSRGDVYDESVLIWLEADTMLRLKSQGRYSLDEFCRRFFGGASGPPAVVPYSLDDLVRTLNEIVPYDWKEFFEERLHSTSTHAPMGGIEATGWRVAYSATLSDFMKAEEETGKYADLRYSIGVILGENGVVRDVIPTGAAARAGLAPGVRLIAVNQRKYSPAVLRQAIKTVQGAPEPIELLVEDSEFYKTIGVDYHDGERYP
ncbi:MAG: M61 family metallopeptidase [Acidobacteria bacterium]|nr:M61 family metallopeptidase [Acidobacteriota bacterium]